MDAKTKIFGFTTFIEVCQKNIYDKTFHQFHRRKKSEVTDMTDAAVIVDHQKIIASDLKERFSDLKQIDFQTWVMQPMLVDISDVLLQHQEEL